MNWIRIIWLFGLFGTLRCFSYEHNHNKGPENWRGICKTGKRQSPIDIQTGSVIQATQKVPLVIGRFNSIPKQNFLVNNGHSTRFNMVYDDGKAPSLKGGPLKGDTYLLDHFHFHSGRARQKFLVQKPCT